MAQVIYSAGALDDLERIFIALAADDPTLAENSVRLIRESLNVLGDRALLGRAAEEGMRERVISRGRTGYVALYRFVELDDTVLIAAIRHRRDAGYPDPR